MMNFALKMMNVGRFMLSQVHDVDGAPKNLLLRTSNGVEMPDDSTLLECGVLGGETVCVTRR